jgi:hypothetical protein
VTVIVGGAPQKETKDLPLDENKLKGADRHGLPPGDVER